MIYNVLCTYEKIFSRSFQLSQRDFFIRRRGEKIQSHSSIVRSNIFLHLSHHLMQKKNLETCIKNSLANLQIYFHTYKSTSAMIYFNSMI